MKVLIATGRAEDMELSTEEGITVMAAYNTNTVLDTVTDYDAVVLAPDLPGTLEFDKLLYLLKQMKKRVILLLESANCPALKVALACGIYDILIRPVESEDLIRTILSPADFADACSILDPALAASLSSYTAPQSFKLKANVQDKHTLVFWSANGGEGKTTIVSALANKLAATTPVVVADFKEITPHLHNVFGVTPTPKQQLAQYIATGDLNWPTLKTFLHRLKNNLWLLTGFGIQEFHLMSVSSFQTILQVLRTQFPCVLVEVNSGVAFASTVAALGMADKVFMPLLPTVQSLNDTVDLLSFAERNWALDITKVSAVLNKTRPVGNEVDQSLASMALPVSLAVNIADGQVGRDISAFLQAV